MIALCILIYEQKTTLAVKLISPIVSVCILLVLSVSPLMAVK